RFGDLEADAATQAAAGEGQVSHTDDYREARSRIARRAQRASRPRAAATPRPLKRKDRDELEAKVRRLVEGQAGNGRNWAQVGFGASQKV
ncbi:MAG: hypothetical protein ACR2NH_10275, partial [Solirubrobacteraceae bacterium]